MKLGDDFDSSLFVVIGFAAVVKFMEGNITLSQGLLKQNTEKKRIIGLILTWENYCEQKKADPKVGFFASSN